MTRRVVVTGAGAVTSVGTGAEAFWQSLRAGRSGVRRITAIDTAGLRSQIAGEITDFDPLAFLDRREATTMDRTTQLAVAAAEQAVREAGEPPPADAALVVGTAIAGIGSDDAMQKIYHEKGARFMPPMAIPLVMYNAAEGNISRRLGIRGPGFTVSTACASSSNAIGEAFRMVRGGLADVALAGGADAMLSPVIFAGWCAMRVLSRRNDTPEAACRPYSRDRDGMVLGEGAGFVVLEELDRARARGATILAEVAGYGSSHDAGHITAPDAAGQAAAMGAALRDAGMAPGDLDYLCGHGTATPLNDKTETAAVRALFAGAEPPPMSSIKSMIGHTLGASGALALIATCHALRDGVMPPTINRAEPDPECDIDCVPNVAREAPLRAAMVNAFGFGGANAALVARRLA